MTHAIAPDYLEKVSAQYHAEKTAQHLCVSFWAHHIPDANTGYHDKEAIDHLEQLAALFGCRLEPILTEGAE